jgi:hypothetical protein
MRSVLNEFLQQLEQVAERGQVISLGCGFDPTYFSLCSGQLARFESCRFKATSQFLRFLGKYEFFCSDNFNRSLALQLS